MMPTASERPCKRFHVDEAGSFGISQCPWGVVNPSSQNYPEVCIMKGSDAPLIAGSVRVTFSDDWLVGYFRLTVLSLCQAVSEHF